MKPSLTRLLKQPVEVVDLVQGSEPWFALRRQKKTASETPIILGLSPWSTPQKLAQAKYHNHTEESGGNKFTRHGHDNEDSARKFYEAITDVPFAPAIVVRGEYL